jgi:hypothetical protein
MALCGSKRRTGDLATVFCWVLEFLEVLLEDTERMMDRQNSTQHAQSKLIVCQSEFNQDEMAAQIRF